MTDMLFGIEAATLGAIIIPLITADITDAINKDTHVKFVGGAGYMDYIAVAAEFDAAKLEHTVNVTKIIRAEKVNLERTRQAGFIAPAKKRVKRAHFDESTIASGL